MDQFPLNIICAFGNPLVAGSLIEAYKIIDKKYIDIDGNHETFNADKAVRYCVDEAYYLDSIHRNSKCLISPVNKVIIMDQFSFAYRLQRRWFYLFIEWPESGARCSYKIITCSPNTLMAWTTKFHHIISNECVLFNLLPL